MVARTTLGDVLRNAEKHPKLSALFLPFDEKWRLETKAMVVDESDIDDADSNPDAAREGLEYALVMSDVRSIRKNLLRQRPKADAALMLEAFLHYYDNDAYIALD